MLLEAGADVAFLKIWILTIWERMVIELNLLEAVADVAFLNTWILSIWERMVIELNLLEAVADVAFLNTKNYQYEKEWSSSWTF